MPIRLRLTSVPVFQFLSPEHLAHLASLAKMIEKTKNEAILVRGEPVMGVYIVGEGHVGVYPPGAAVAIAQLGSGESFGEMSFLEQGVASATIRAEETPTKLVILLQSDLRQFVASEPSFGSALYRGIAFALSKKLRHTTEKITAEIASSKELFAALKYHDIDSLSDLSAIPDDLAKQNQHMLGAIDRCIQSANELIPKASERTRPHPLIASLDDLRGQYLKFYPSLGQQILLMTKFVRRIEATIFQIGSS